MVKNHYTDRCVQKKSKKKSSPSRSVTNVDYGERIVQPGPSGSGKTNTQYEFIELSKQTFHKVYYWSSVGPHEPLPETLQEKLGPLGQIVFQTLDNVPSIKQFIKDRGEYPDRKDLIIWDDFLGKMNDKEFVAKMMEYATFGRKCGMVQIYSAQSFYSLPKDLRNNCNRVWLHGMPSNNDLKDILRLSNSPIDINQLVVMFNMASAKPFSFFNINLTASCPLDEKYCRDFTDRFLVESAGFDKHGREMFTVRPDGWYDTIPRKERFPEVIYPMEIVADHMKKQKKRKLDDEDPHDNSKKAKNGTDDEKTTDSNDN